MDDTLQTLARDGRRGLGTLVVYSAGNDDRIITGWRTWAAHPNTLAVANSAQPDASGVERKVSSSNFGPEIDVCAQGAAAPSLDSTGGEQNFGGTSAAAPTVAAIAALVLSANPTLTWRQVRDILRETAVKIDRANTDPVGQWVNDFSKWYGYGRVDAAAAVALATVTGGQSSTDFDGDGTSEIPVTSPWGMGLLTYNGVGLDSMAMVPNGTRIGEWLLNTADNRLDVMADLDGDGRAELLISSPWGIGVLSASSTGYSQSLIARNGTRFGEWLLNTADNRFGPVGDFDGDGQDEVLITSPWGIAILKLSGSTLMPVTMAANGSRLGNWLLNTADNRFGPVGDFDGDGRDEVLITSPWGIAILKLSGSTLTPVTMAANGNRLGEWLLNTADNRFGPVGDFDGDGQDEVLVTSPWGVAILRLGGSTLTPVMMAANGTRFGEWLLNTADNRFRAAADFEGTGTDDLFITSRWGIGTLFLNGSNLDARAMAPNGTRFDGWLLNTADNKFSRFVDITGDGRADILVASPWGVGIMSPRSDTFEVPFLAPNSTRFGGWLLNTADNVL